MNIKRFFVHLVICIVLLVIIGGGYTYGLKKINKTIVNIQIDDFSWVVQVDDVKLEKDIFVLEGFAFELNQNAEEGAFDIALYNLDTGKYFFPKMEYVEREDVNNYFFCEYDYTNSGFTATIKAKKMNFEKNDYEILLLPKGSRKPYQFATYLSEGQLMYANPNEYMSLEVIGTDLEEIVENGVLRAYRPDIGVYIYQHEGSLFWIVNSSYTFEENDSYIMEYQIDTTQKEKLPQHRIENGWLWDNIGFVFENNEIKDMYCGRYRVAKADLPTEYSLLKIWTGYYNEGWIWVSEFRPRYDFK